MGYVKSKVEYKLVCENCHERINRCEYCNKDIKNQRYVYCLDEKFGGHSCSTKCYNEHKKLMKYANVEE